MICPRWRIADCMPAHYDGLSLVWCAGCVHCCTCGRTTRVLSPSSAGRSLPTKIAKAHTSAFCRASEIALNKNAPGRHTTLCHTTNPSLNNHKLSLPLLPRRFLPIMQLVCAMQGVARVVAEPLPASRALDPKINKYPALPPQSTLTLCSVT